MSTLAPIRVVLADDEGDVRALLGITLGLEHDHFSVVGEAANGKQAVDMVDHEHPDAIVLDLLMPVMGGMEAIPEIRRCSPETKIVVFSAVADEMSDEAMAAGADAFVQKTKFITELSETLQRVCHIAA
jgi:DNA-binding NarL/FixJ family response regulator